MNILVIGASGVLGRSVCATALRSGHRVVRADISAKEEDTSYLDICDATQVQRIIAERAPDIVFHLAAETDLDRCETDPAHARRVNVMGTEHVAVACAARGATMVYVSTGGIFDGTKGSPYVETDIPNPVNVYARTKLEGERIVQATVAKHFILRATWVIGGGKNDKKFVGKIVRRIQDGAREILAPADIFGSPTFAQDFAANLLPVVQNAPYGLYHMANRGACSRFELARKIVEFMGKEDVVSVRAVSADAFPAAAPRPRSEVILNARLEKLGLNAMPPWEETLKKYIKSEMHE